MPQKKNPFASKPDTSLYLPKASTDFSSGDVVVAARRHDYISRAALGAAGEIVPIAALREGAWAAGVIDHSIDTDIVGATEYATPTVKYTVQKRGQFFMALTDTVGKKGDYVRYSSGASGAQLFAIDNQEKGVAIFKVAVDFSGGSADDTQLVELIEHPVGGPNIYHYLENRVVDGLRVIQHSVSGNRTVDVAVVGGNCMINNKHFFLASDDDVTLGTSDNNGTSTVRMRYVVARSGGFGARTGSTTKAALASFTAVGVTADLFVPTTFTAAELPIALAIAFSAGTLVTGNIKNLRSPGIPKVGSWGV